MTRTSGQLAIRMTVSHREMLDAAARRAGVSTGAYMLEAALGRAVQGGIMIPPEVAHLIRQQAEERGIDEVTLAALVVQQAVLLAQPRTNAVRTLCRPGQLCSLHSQPGGEHDRCPWCCDARGCWAEGVVQVDGERWCRAHAPL